MQPDHLPLETGSSSDIFVFGLNHRTSPLALREELALNPDELCRALTGLVAVGLDETVLLSTCNRIELYAVARVSEQTRTAVEQFLADLRGIAPETLRAHAYYETGYNAVTHLMRVAAGVDSMILGEAQILGQVRQAFAAAQAAGTTGPLLSHLFTLAARAGKRARAETEISRHVTSVSHAAVALARMQVAEIHRARALVVGSGEMAHLAAQALHRHNVTAIRCINRTYGRAEALARAFDGEALDWQQLPEALAEADVVIAATSAPHTVIQQRDVQQALARRDKRPLVLIDIALPRDVDEGVRALPGVFYYDLDDLNTFVQANLARREAALAGVDAVIAEEAARYMAWYRGRSVSPVIVALREKAAALAHDEVEAALRRLGNLDAGQQKIVERMAQRIVNRILHEPTTRLKAGAAGNAAPDYAAVVRDLFALDEESQ
ncbi:MAG TPA: glutamyl-tRNA reductase [Spirillospora sp.]|nr:glutamyl-tRNA reductase [Spirillospora sp.]